MQQYIDLLLKCFRTGAVDKVGRNGKKVRSVFGETLRFDLAQGFPAVTTKKLAFKQVVAELLFFISGGHDIRELWRSNSHIWDANFYSEKWQQRIADYGLEEYSLGYVYGSQWRNWNNDYIDQLHILIHNLQNDPYSRRHVVSAWNVAELDYMCLPPCHVMFMCDVEPGNKGNKLNMSVIMRSGDVFLGIPFNIASYAILTHMLCQLCHMQPGVLSLYIHNAHLYESATEAAIQQIQRNPLPLPTLQLNDKIMCIDDFTMQDVQLLNYQCHPVIHAPLED